FEAMVAADPSRLDGWLGLAMATARLGLRDEATAAIDRALALEPRNLRALLFKGDHLGATGQEEAALRYYGAALRVAEGSGSLPPDVIRGLQRAREITARRQAAIEQQLMEGLVARGLAADSLSPRFAESLDISFGRRRIYPQSPTRYYFPGLPLQQFFARELFDWAPAVEAATASIRAELQALLAEPGHFAPYLQSDGAGPLLNDRSQLDNPDWSACYLLRNGALTPQGERCRQALAALSGAPLPRIPGRSPNVLFSKLAPRTRIPPHNGFLNTRLICHLPLVVPPDCGRLRCGNAEQAWREGELLVFDDSIEHEAWNDSNEERVVLLFEIWRPELGQREREEVSALLELSGEYAE
ncbi:MAG: aspartyl/asparaginyl beta-hydroxylase domain-containing protein, partial [Gammaproteobacteria bacterium]